MGPVRHRRRAAAASVLVGLTACAVFGLTACGAGGGEPSTRPSDRGSPAIDRPSPGTPEGGADATRTPAAQRTPTREPDRTEAPPETPAGRPTSAAPEQPEPAQTTKSSAPAVVKPPTKTKAPTQTKPPTEAKPPAATEPQGDTATTPVQSESPVAAVTQGGDTLSWVWIILVGLVVALVIGGLLLHRSQLKSAWDAEARTLESETRTVVTTRLPPALAATTVSQRALTWPPIRASLVDLIGRWNGLTERAVDETRRNWSTQIAGLLQGLVGAVDAENDAVAAGQDATLLRPRVNDAERALIAVLTTQPQYPRPTAEPGTSAAGI
jgi:hypothetical protein